jgi:large subunit ribosomal protein L3
MSFILGKKMKMTQIWQGQNVVPVTAILARPNEIKIVRNTKRDGYEAVQVALGNKKCEFKTTATADLKVGSMIDVSQFSEGDKVKVSGTMKGRGFQGVVKRHNFGGGPKTHGQKNRFRAPGSIGSTAPQRVTKGRRMAGHMGMTRVTVRNLTIAKIDAAGNTLFVKGAVPGAIGGFLEIRKEG